MNQELKFGDVMVFRHDYNGRATFSIGVSSKKFVDGHTTDERVTAFINVQFPRDNAPHDKERIDITRSFLGAYEGKDKVGIKLIVMEWTPHIAEDSFGV